MLPADICQAKSRSAARASLARGGWRRRSKRAAKLSPASPLPELARSVATPKKTSTVTQLLRRGCKKMCLSY